MSNIATIYILNLDVWSFRRGESGVGTAILGKEKDLMYLYRIKD
jgi:hypothetical protein